MSTMPSFLAEAARTDSRRSRTKPGNRSVSPMVWSRIRLSRISDRSESRYSASSIMSAPTSSSGRPQFCELNA